MDTLELIKELFKRPKGEITYALFQMMADGKFTFDELSTLYVAYLEAVREDLTGQLMDAEVCIAESFHDKKTKDKNKGKGTDYRHTQHCLRVLNRSKRFQMQKLNEKYEYDEDFAKTMSLYERGK